MLPLGVNSCVSSCLVYCLYNAEVFVYLLPTLGFPASFVLFK